MPGAGIYVGALSCSVAGTIELLVVAALQGAAASACGLAGLLLAGTQLGLVYLLVHERTRRRRARTRVWRAQQRQRVSDLAFDRWVQREASRGLVELQRWLTANRP